MSFRLCYQYHFTICVERIKFPPDHFTSPLSWHSMMMVSITMSGRRLNSLHSLILSKLICPRLFWWQHQYLSPISSHLVSPNNKRRPKYIRWENTIYDACDRSPATFPPSLGVEESEMMIMGPYKVHQKKKVHGRLIFKYNINYKRLSNLKIRRFDRFASHL